jgi:Sulfotransferase domain
VTKNDLGRDPYRTDGRVIVSYPKSGRTWVQFALAAHGIDVMVTHAGCSTNWREIGRPFGGIKPELANIPLVFLHRNPLDTVVSMYHQVTYRDLRGGSRRFYRMALPLYLRGDLPPRDIDSFVLHPRHGIEKICRFNRAWLDHLAGRKDCLVLTYEALRAAPEAGFQTLLDFFGVAEVTGADLARASDFETMRKAEQGGRKQSVDKGAKVRKGKVHGYVEELRPETITACREIMGRFDFGIDI